jgi:hypothetical protein
LCRWQADRRREKRGERREEERRGEEDVSAGTDA